MPPPQNDPPADPAPVPIPRGPLSHIVGGAGRERTRMVDVSAKPVTERSALARARVVFPAGVLARMRAGTLPKGPIEEVARTAGILAAKRTGELVPLCHPLGLDHVDVSFRRIEKDGQEMLEAWCRARCRGRTGVEMEAMTGASVAALTVYDMTKALDPGIKIELVQLCEKRGGKSGPWRAPDLEEGELPDSDSLDRSD